MINNRNIFAIGPILVLYALFAQTGLSLGQACPVVKIGLTIVEDTNGIIYHSVARAKLITQSDNEVADRGELARMLALKAFKDIPNFPGNRNGRLTGIVDDGLCVGQGYVYSHLFSSDQIQSELSKSGLSNGLVNQNVNSQVPAVLRSLKIIDENLNIESKFLDEDLGKLLNLPAGDDGESQ
jgi:hypothetical protein